MSKNTLPILIALFLIGCTTPPESTEPVAQATLAPSPTDALMLEDHPELTWQFESANIDGTNIEFATLLPIGFDPAETYPLLLALPPGGQTEQMVEAGLDTFWKRGALYGFIIVSPVKPADSNYMSDGSLLLPAFVAHLHDKFNIDGKPHLGGVSNGGISTFKAGLERPDLYQSLTVLPGYARRDGGDVSTLAGLKVTLYVGENDGAWVTNSQSTHDRLVAAGHDDVVLEIFPAEGHLIGPLSRNGAGKIFERLLEGN